MDKLENDIERVKRDLEEGEAASAPEPREVRKVVKKVKKVAKSKEATKAEKAPKKAAKTNGHAPEGDVVTVAQLAEEAKIAPQSARVKLRASNIERPEGRWEWALGSKGLKKAREVLGLA